MGLQPVGHVRPVDTFINSVYATKISQKFRWLGIPLIVIFLHFDLQTSAVALFLRMGGSAWCKL